MSTRQVLTSSDPTFETQGPMGVFLSNQTDIGSVNASTPGAPVGGIQASPTEATLGYGPSGNPPPPWVAGADWQVVPAQASLLLPSTWVVPNTFNTDYNAESGSTCVMSVTDRSANKVAIGGQYVFDMPFYLGTGGNTRLSVHYTVTGVAGGSTVLPGFGLFNLSSNPGAWTYVAPTSFDGLWSLQLRCDDTLNYATLSVAYVNYGSMNMGVNMSRLFYSVSGSSRANFPFAVTPSQRLGPTPVLPVDRSKASRIDIVRPGRRI